MNDIEIKLGKLEKEVRETRRLAVFALISAAFVVTAALIAACESPNQNVPETVKAKEFILVDDAGRVRAKLALAEGVPGLVFFDERGKPRATLDLADGMPGLGLFDERGTSRVVLGLTGRGPALGLLDESGENRLAVALNELGPGVGLYDKQGNTRAVFSYDDGGMGGAGLSLFDAYKRVLWCTP